MQPAVRGQAPVYADAVRFDGAVLTFVRRLCTGYALAGGLVFVALIAMSLVSIVGRKLFNAPIQGDIELMQMGSAIGASALLPYCEIADRHIKVDVLTEWLPPRARSALDAPAHAALAVFAALLAWRAGLQCLSVQQAGEVSALLSVPTWVSMSLMVPGLALLAVAALCRTAQACANVCGASR